MNLINQATNYLIMSSEDDKYGLVISVNITCMMVLASIYISVSASLPPTSDVKPVETWLIFNLAYPFVTILVNVILQVDLLINTVDISINFKSLEKNLRRGMKRVD